MNFITQSKVTVIHWVYFKQAPHHRDRSSTKETVLHYNTDKTFILMYRTTHGILNSVCSISKFNDRLFVLLNFASFHFTKCLNLCCMKNLLFFLLCLYIFFCILFRVISWYPFFSFPFYIVLFLKIYEFCFTRFSRNCLNLSGVYNTNNIHKPPLLHWKYSLEGYLYVYGKVNLCVCAIETNEIFDIEKKKNNETQLLFSSMFYQDYNL